MKQLLKFIEQHNMLAKNSYVLCAVSGGADSMCLLSMLDKLAETGAIRIAAAHFDHGLRGEESDRDAEFVRNYCASHDIAFFFGAGNVRAFSENKGLSIETAARELRYDFLRRTAERIGADRIATAHTADDNAETMLMNLIRGAGLRGICGIPPVRGNVIRPILYMTREQVEAYLSQNKIPHVEDSTNAETIYTRNKIRANVIPLLKEFNPNFLSSVTETTELLSEDENYLSVLANKLLWSTSREAFGIRLQTDDFRKLPKPVSARVIMGAADELGAGMSRALVEGVRELALSDNPSAQRSFAGGLTVIREYGDILFTRLPADSKTFSPVELKPNFPTNINELGLSFLYMPGVPKEKIYNSLNTFLFKTDAICGKITIRPRKSGDKIAFGGKKGTKSLKKLFIDEKIPLRLRESIPVLADEKGIIAVMGYGIDSRCSPAPGDKLSSVTIEKIGGESYNVGNF